MCVCVSHTVVFSCSPMGSLHICQLALAGVKEVSYHTAMARGIIENGGRREDNIGDKGEVALQLRLRDD